MMGDGGRGRGGRRGRGRGKGLEEAIPSLMRRRRGRPRKDVGAPPFNPSTVSANAAAFDGGSGPSTFEELGSLPVDAAARNDARSGQGEAMAMPMNFARGVSSRMAPVSSEETGQVPGHPYFPGGHPEEGPVEHDWPPPVEHEQFVQRQQDPAWTRWEPEKFVPPLTNVQENILHWQDDDEQRLVYACSWPVYVVHRFNRPRAKRSKLASKPATVTNTRVAADSVAPQAQAQKAIVQEGQRQENPGVNVSGGH